MPKGGLLHAHLDATVNTDFLMTLALQYSRIHVRVPQRLTTSTLSHTLPELSPIPVTTSAGNLSISHAEYQPDTWVPLSVARDGFDVALGGKEGFDKWIRDSMTINPAEAYGTHNTVTKVCVALVSLNDPNRVVTKRHTILQIWQKFQSTFRIFNVSSFTISSSGFGHLRRQCAQALLFPVAIDSLPPHTWAIHSTIPLDLD